MNFAKFWCREYIHISKRLLKAKLDYRQRQNKAKSAPSAPPRSPQEGLILMFLLNFLEMDSASCPKFLSLFSVLLDATKLTYRSLVRATSAIQYGGLLPLSDHSILLKIRIKTKSKWLQIFTILADTESWIIFLSGVNCFEHVARTG